MISVKTRHLANLLLGVVAVTLVVTPIALIFRWTVDGGYAPWRNYISDLSAGPTGSNAAFIVMILSFSLLLGLFFAVSPNLLKTKYGASSVVHVGSFFGIAYSIDSIIMVFFPLDPARPAVYQTHIVLGVVLFVCMTLFLGTYGAALRKKPGLFRLGGYFGLIAALLSGAFAVLLFLVEIVGAISSNAIVYLIQWSALMTLNLWALLTGLQLRRDNA